MILSLFMLMGIFGMVACAGGLAWLLFSRRLRDSLGDGHDWTRRFERLEAEVKRLSDQDTRLGLDDEVRRLDEKVEFLEDLLAERAGTGALPPGDVEESRAAPRKP